MQQAGYRADRRRERLPPGGLRAVRPQHPPRPPAERGRRRTSTRSRPRRTSRSARRAFVDASPRSRARARSASSTEPAAGTTRRSRAGEVILCGGAINSPQLLQLSGVGNAAELAALGIDVGARPARASARTCRTTSRSTSSTRARSRSSMQPALAEVAPAVDRLPVAVLPPRPRRDEPLRGRRLRPQQRRRRLPEPDVPLPAARDPLRRHGARRAATATRSTSGRCTPTPAARCRSARADPRVHPALRFNYLSTDQDRREWVEAIRVARHILGQPAFAPFDGGELSPGPGGRDRRADPRLGRARRRDRAPPVVHAAAWAPTGAPWSTRRRCASTASTGCASSTRRSSPTSQRQHLRAGDDGRREGAADLILGNTPLAETPCRLLPPYHRRAALTGRAASRTRSRPASRRRGGAAFRTPQSSACTLRTRCRRC